MFLFASDGAAAVEQALKIAFQYWWNQGDRRADRLPGPRRRLPRRHGRITVAGGGRIRYRSVRPVALPGGHPQPRLPPAGLARRGPGRPGASTLLAWPRWSSSRSSRGPPACTSPVRRMSSRLGKPRARTPASCWCVTKWPQDSAVPGRLFASEQCGLRPDLMAVGKGLAAGYLPMSATVAARRVADAFLGEDLGPQTLYHGHSFSGNALAAAVALRHLQPARRVGRTGQRAGPLGTTGRSPVCSSTPSRRSPRCGCAA